MIKNFLNLGGRGGFGLLVELHWEEPAPAAIFFCMYFHLLCILREFFAIFFFKCQALTVQENKLLEGLSTEGTQGSKFCDDHPVNHILPTLTTKSFLLAA